MKLHKDKEAFETLSQVVSQWRHIPLDAVKRDYLIVLILRQLSQSEFMERCVFKGGTSLSKCYPGTIERFSEDIDLTFLNTELSEKQKDKALKKIEEVLWSGLSVQKLPDERSKVAKSSLVWLDDIGSDYRIKLEIGSTIRLEPSHKMTLQTYIQDYLEENGMFDVIEEFELERVEVNVLDITRTFLDKVLAVKRHAFNKDLLRKVRHIYDVVQLFEHTEIQNFLSDEVALKELLNLTKKTDQFYIGKRKIILKAIIRIHLLLLRIGSLCLLNPIYGKIMKAYMRNCFIQMFHRNLMKLFECLNRLIVFYKKLKMISKLLVIFIWGFGGEATMF